MSSSSENAMKESESEANKKLEFKTESLHMLPGKVRSVYCETVPWHVSVITAGFPRLVKASLTQRHTHMLIV